MTKLTMTASPAVACLDSSSLHPRVWGRFGENHAGLAVNLAGHLKSDAARAIWFTHRHSYGGCRVFHDRIETDDEKRKVPKGTKAKGEGLNDDGRDAFLNVVFFCSPAGKPLDFRSHREGLLGS